MKVWVWWPGFAGLLVSWLWDERENDSGSSSARMRPALVFSLARQPAGRRQAAARPRPLVPRVFFFSSLPALHSSCERFSSSPFHIAVLYLLSMLKPVIGVLFVAAVATGGDAFWYEMGVRHRMTAGALHGALLLGAVGLVLGLDFEPAAAGPGRRRGRRSRRRNGVLRHGVRWAAATRVSPPWSPPGPPCG